MKYLLEATLTTLDEQGNSLQNDYVFSFVVQGIREVGQGATIYDKELKMHFENTSALATVYEIETDNIYLNLAGEFGKTADFLRRTFYRYDWMQLRINRQSKLLAVENGEEALKQWEEIRTLLLADYNGKPVMDYITKIDTRMADPDFRIRPASQYFYFGLLFPVIPPKHPAEWQRGRHIALSDFDDILFDEQIKYEQTDSQLRKYSITGGIVTGEDCRLNEFAGYITVPCNDIHPTGARVGISYDAGDTRINWDFKLTKLN